MTVPSLPRLRAIAGRSPRLRRSAAAIAKQSGRLRRRLAPIGHRLDVTRRRLRRNFYASDLDLMRHYQEHFPDTAWAFQEFLLKCDLVDLKARSLTDTRQPVGVVVMPWLVTPVPWFSIALGLGLARRGTDVTFIWDERAFPLPPGQLDSQNDWIDRTLDGVRHHFPVVRLSEEHPQPALPGDEAALDKLIRLNLLWALRGDTPTEAELATAREARDHLRDTLGAIRGLLARMSFRYLVVPGGIYGTSGLYLHAGREARTRVATFDSGRGWSVASPDGVVAHQLDVPRTFNALYTEGSPDVAEAVEVARLEYDHRIQGNDRMAYQIVSPKTRDDFPSDMVLIPLSVEWDSAALGRHHIFDDSADWLVATVGHLLERTESPVVVRQHPSERRELERSRFRVVQLLGERFGHHPRLRFVSAEEDVNTYDLLGLARLVLPYVSTIGIEAAALGKTVIPAGDPYYRALGFTWNATSRAEYFDLIDRAMAGTLPALPDQVRRAWLCFYINAVCYRVFTDFSGQSTEFWKWCRQKPDVLFGRPEVQDLLTAIDDDRPVALLRHARRTASRLGALSEQGTGPR